MTTGALIFAYNNEHIDYLAMADWSAKQIHRHLDIPVCVVTNVERVPTNHHFDRVVVVPSTDTQQRHFADFNVHATWHNGARVSAYDVTPWDKTLVLDADYVVATDQLGVLFDTDYDFLSHRLAVSASGRTEFEHNNRFGQVGMPMNWATVMCFKKCTAVKLMFDSMQMIKQHWDHYRSIYKINEHAYRNDFALSIALNLINGHTLINTDIPWNLLTVMPQEQLTKVDTDLYRLDYVDSQGKAKWILLNQDFHAMGKLALKTLIENDH